MDEVHLDKVDSTQKWAKKHLSSFNKNKITCILADEQTHGMGRQGRSWYSPKGENIYATFYVSLPLDTLHIQSLALLLGYSFAMVLSHHGLRPEIRWPNDILLSNKKVSGILCETQRSEKGIDVFLGMGINVNMPLSDLKKIDKPATSLFEETQEKWDRSSLMAEIQLQFEKDLERFLRERFFAFHEAFSSLLAYRGKEVILDDGEKKHEGILHSISSDGELKLLLPSKELKTFATGYLSVKK